LTELEDISTSHEMAIWGGSDEPSRYVVYVRYDKTIDVDNIKAVIYKGVTISLE
jgi:hypothetical protein